MLTRRGMRCCYTGVELTDVLVGSGFLLEEVSCAFGKKYLPDADFWPFFFIGKSIIWRRPKAIGLNLASVGACGSPLRMKARVARTSCPC